MTAGQLAVVTGAIGGIGQEIARQLARDGFALALIDRIGDKLSAFCEELRADGGVAEPYACDITDSEMLPATIRKIQAAQGFVSVVVNNAGIGPTGKTIEDSSMKEWSRAIDVNVRSGFQIAQSVLPAMKQKGFGRIVNISSLLGITGMQNSALYVISKHALVGLTRAIAAEAGRHGVTCNVICPGNVQTPGLQFVNDGFTQFPSLPARMPTPGGAIGKPNQIAQIVGFLAQEDSHYMNGAILVADGGLMSDLGIT